MEMQLQTKRDPIALVDFILKILEGRGGYEQGSGSQDKDCLVDENGKINENARARMREQLITLKRMLIVSQRIRARQSGRHLMLVRGFLPSYRKETKCQLFIPEHLLSASTEQFGEILTKMLQKQFIICELVTKTSIKEEVPLLCVCPFSARLDTSIDHALTGFQMKVGFIVIILNQGTEESLPAISSRTKLQTKPDFTNIIFIDMAYNKDDKLYKCDMNTKAFAQIKTFVENKM